MTYNILFAGFGGQGVLFSGKLTAYAALIENKEVSWLPSYGPEMRGGTAHCSVIVSDNPIGSPLVLEPNILIAMNGPSLDKFEKSVEPGGVIIVDSTLVTRKIKRDDVKAFYVDATRIASEHNLKGLANVIIMGKMLKETNFTTLDILKKSVEKCVPPRKAHLIEANIRAIEVGMKL